MTAFQDFDVATVAPTPRQWLTDWLKIRPYADIPAQQTFGFNLICKPLLLTKGSDWAHFWSNGARCVFELMIGLRKCLPDSSASDNEQGNVMTKQEWSTWVKDVYQAFISMIQMCVRYVSSVFVLDRTRFLIHNFSINHVAKSTLNLGLVSGELDTADASHVSPDSLDHGVQKTELLGYVPIKSLRVMVQTAYIEPS